MAWDTIDNATEKTKDGHDVLVCAMPGGRQAVAHYSLDVPGGGWVVEDPARPITPTHFQELGPLPSATPAPEATPQRKARSEPAS